jgi:TM2 domain-containing membrane protein YozV
MSETPPVQTTSAPSTPSSKDLIRFENEKKSAGIALILCWVLGIFGGHRFYLGRPHAVTMLVITLVSFPLCIVIIGFVGVLTTWIWMIADLYQVSRWAREYNTALLAKIESGQG